MAQFLHGAFAGRVILQPRRQHDAPVGGAELAGLSFGPLSFVFGGRHGDFALAGVTCGVEIADDRLARTAIGYFGMAGTPVRATAAEQEVVGSRIDEMNFDEVAQLAVADLDPPSDIHASGAHRKRIGAAITQEALRAAIAEARHPLLPVEVGVREDVFGMPSRKRAAVRR